MDTVEEGLERGRAHAAAGEYEAALAVFERALGHAPTCAPVHWAIAEVLAASGRLEAAIDAYDQALDIEADESVACARASAWRRLSDQVANALASPKARRSAMAEDIGALGSRLFTRGRAADAVLAYDMALRLAPGVAHRLNSRGWARAQCGDLLGGLADIEAALVVDEACGAAAYNQAAILLTLGRFEDAWPLYAQSRSFRVPLRPNVRSPRLKSIEEAGGKHVLVVQDEGLGDTIQTARFLDTLLTRTRTVTLLVSDGLAPLLRQIANVRTVDLSQTPPAHDAHIGFMALGALTMARPGHLGRDVPYLFADPERVARWGRRMSGGGLRIALVWSGNPEHSNDRNRSFPLAALAPVAAIPGMRLICVQKNHGLDQLKRLPPGMTVETVGTDDFDIGDTAAIMSVCDLVISCDSMPAHLGGALGRPVWIALPFAPDWRWMLNRDDSPWYPTARLFRQPRPGDWESVFAKMASELKAMMGTDVGSLST